MIGCDGDDLGHIQSSADESGVAASLVSKAGHRNGGFPFDLRSDLIQKVRGAAQLRGADVKDDPG
jgi:hypothetical protein